MKIKITKIGVVFRVILSICILVHLIAWNTGCSSCDNKKEIEKAYSEGYYEGYEKGKSDGEQIGYNKGYEKGKNDGEQVGYNKGYEKGKDDGYSQGHKIGYGKGYKNGKDDGYRKGHSEGYKKGTSFFLGKWWNPSLGLVIISLISVFSFSALYYVLRKPTRRLIIKLEEQTENFLKQKKSNKDAEQEIKIMEEREKHRFTLMIQEVFDNARKYLNEEDDHTSLEKLRKEAKKMIQKAQVNDLQSILETYRGKLRDEIAKRRTKSQNDITLEPESDYLQSVSFKALPEGGA